MLIKNETQIKIYPLYGDLMFKYIFGSQKNAKFTADMLESFLNLKKGSLKDLKIKNSVKLDRKTVLDKKFEIDVLVELPNKELMNLEMYTKFDRNSEIKSVMYITSIFSNSLKSSEDYNMAKRVTQINFVKSKVYKSDELIGKYCLVNQNNINDTLIPDLLQIYVINVALQKNLGYNKLNKRFHLWTKLINADSIEEMKSLVKGNEIMEEALKSMEEFSNEEYVQDYHTQEVLIRSQHNSEMKELEQNYKAQETLIRSQHNSEMKELEQNYKAQETLIRSQHNSEMKELEQNYKAQETLIRSQHNSEMKELEQNYKAQETLIRSQHKSEIKELEQNYKNELAETKEEVAKNLLKTNLTLEEIAAATGITLKEVKKLKEAK